jgi:hypothetical protein
MKGRFPPSIGLLVLLTLVSVESRPSSHGQKLKPLDLGSSLELFVDDYLIDSMQGVRLQLQEPRPAGIVLKFDQPWEGTTSLYHTVFKDGDLYRMYYRGSSHAGYTFPQFVAPGETVIPEHEEVSCYVESKDGIAWTRPSLGLIEFEGSKDNNIVWSGRGGHNFAPFKDGNPEADPSRRYKALAGGPLLALASPDGIRWTKIQEEPVISDGAFDSLNVPFWDPVRELYVAIYRDFTDGVRTVKCATSEDFIHWTKGEWADYGGAPREHFYTNATQPYFRAPQIYLAFPKRFVPWRTYHDNAPGAGVSDGVFMTSRDGVHWDRRFGQAFIRPGRNPKNWVHRTNMVSSGVVPTGDDEISFYVARHYTSPSAHLERMTVRMDGFASLRADYKGGEMVTKPLIFKGSDLILNFSTSAAGSIRIEVQDLHGHPVPGFALEDSPLIFGDEVEHTVKWDRSHPKATRDTLNRIAGEPVRLKIVMRDADLYSLRFR